MILIWTWGFQPLLLSRRVEVCSLISSHLVMCKTRVSWRYKHGRLNQSHKMFLYNFAKKKNAKQKRKKKKDAIMQYLSHFFSIFHCLQLQSDNSGTRVDNPLTSEYSVLWAGVNPNFVPNYKVILFCSVILHFKCIHLRLFHLDTLTFLFRPLIIQLNTN